VSGVGCRDRYRNRHRNLIAAILLALLVTACSSEDKPVALKPTRLIAILPIEPAPSASQPEAGDEEGPRHPLPPEAGMAITGQVYEVLSQDSKLRFVPDLTISDVINRPALAQASGLVPRAVALGKEVKADAVIYGEVHRFRERIGTDYGASEPASVSFDLGIVDAVNGEVMWNGSFSETQQSLSANFLNWWMLWRAGPHWFTARELAGLGVEKLIDDMKDEIGE
jgi:hypothetical protein